MIFISCLSFGIKAKELMNFPDMKNFIGYLGILILVGLTGCKKDDTGPEDSVTPDNFLSGSVYDKLIIEVQYVKGFAPTATALAHFKTFLQQRLNKPAGITVLQSEIPSTGRLTYTIEDIWSIEKNNRTQITGGKILTAYLLFVDGEYAGNSGNSDVLGIAYGGSSMVIFEETIMGFSGGITQPPRWTLEATVIEHELGHALGLVNHGTPMQSSHQDEPHGKHCSNANCLMYYTAETSDIVGNLVGGNVPALDSKCLEDLKANGGK